MTGINGKTLGLVTSVSIGLFSATGLSQDRCYQCHLLLEDNPAVGYTADIHFEMGITCAGCHGGDATTEDLEVSMSAEAGFQGVPRGDTVSAVCARCHSSADAMNRPDFPTDQLEQLSESVHGGSSVSANERLMQCTQCHGSHGIVRVSDGRSPVHPLNVVRTCSACHSDAVYMRSYNPGLPVDQREKYRTSVHGILNGSGDPNTAECTSCHGSHDIRKSEDVRSRVYPTNLPGTCSVCHSNAGYMAHYSIPTDQYETFAAGVHGVALLERHDLAAPACNDCHGNHAATPPGIESISKVCGTCHVLNSSLFSESPHEMAFDELGLPECETCHGNHDIPVPTETLIGTDGEAICADCHSDDEADKGYAFAGSMRRLLDSLEAAEVRAILLVEDAEQKGMEVSEARFRLRDIRQARFESRTIIHSFNEEKTREVLTKGLDAALFVTQKGLEAVDEYYFRRIGFGISTIIITILAVALYLYIKRLEVRQAEAADSSS